MQVKRESLDVVRVAAIDLLDVPAIRGGGPVREEPLGAHTVLLPDERRCLDLPQTRVYGAPYLGKRRTLLGIHAELNLREQALRQSNGRLSFLCACIHGDRLLDLGLDVPVGSVKFTGSDSQ